GPQWVAYSATVTSYWHDGSGGHLQFNLPNGMDPWELPVAGGQMFGMVFNNPYYLTGPKAALDSANEFYIDPNARQISFWLPGNANPNQHLVEVKARSQAFEL